MSDRGQFVGHVPMRQTVAGVTLAEVVHTHGRAMPAHCHPDPYLCLLLTGRYEDTVCGRTRAYAPADATFSPPGFEHRDRVGGGGARFFTISFDPQAGSRYTERAALWDVPQRWSASGPALELARLHLAFVQSGGRPDPMDVESRVLDLWAALARVRGTDRRGASWLAAARARLHDEWAVSPRIVDLAADAGVHPTHFTRAFRARYGIGPAEYRARLRVAAACRALAERQAIRRTAITLGYADQAHLTRDFVARVGVSPAAYQRLLARS